MHFKCGSSAEVQLKTRWSIFDCAKVKLLQVYFRCTLNILHLKTDIIQKIIQFKLDIRNVHCAQIVLQIVSL